MSMELTPQGYLCLVLCAHVPYVKRHKDKADSQEYWLFETLLESYLPLLNLFERLRQESVPFRVGLALSASLLEQLDDEALQQRFLAYVDNRIMLARRECERHANAPALLSLAEMYLSRFSVSRSQYVEKYKCDIGSAFRSLAASGHLELMATAATYAFLPLLYPRETAPLPQIMWGIEAFRRRFNLEPTGFWLPECGYRPQLDEILVTQGVKYTIVDTLSTVGARPRPKYASSYPVRSHAGLTFLTNDLEAKLDVWSNEFGYFSSPEYRDYYCDLSQECPDLDLGDLISDSNHRANTGMKYYRITAPTDHKQHYNQREANRIVWRHAVSFVENRTKQIEWLAERMDRPPVIVLSLNAEFLGHFWFEGILWLEYVLRQVAADGQQVCLELPQTVTTKLSNVQIAEPNAGSWNDGGFAARHVNTANDWFFKHLSLAAQRMDKLANLGHQNDPLRQRLINQAMRELLVAQSCDWPILLSAGQHVKDATKNVRSRLVAFHRLFDNFRESQVDVNIVSMYESRCSIFADIDYRLCCNKKERTPAIIVNSTPNQPASPLTPSTEQNSRDYILTYIVQLQTISRELLNMCREALQKEPTSPSASLSQKAAESIAIVEHLAKLAHDDEILGQYVSTTHGLERVISAISAADNPDELNRLQEEAGHLVNDWGNTVDKLFRSVLTSAD